MDLPSPTDIGKTLADMLLSAGGVPGPIGALIIGAIFGGSDTSALIDALVNQMRAIVDQELQLDDINKVKASVSGVVQYVSTTYADMKADTSRTKQELFDAISPYANDVQINAVGLLMDATYAEAGLAVFLTVGSVHLALLQEQALVDPDHADPATSPFTASVQQHAADFWQSANATWTGITARRLAAIQLVEADFPGAPYMMQPPYSEYHWVDQDDTDAAGQYQIWSTKTDPNAKDLATQSMIDQQNAVLQQLKDQTGNPDAVLLDWNSLAQGITPTSRNTGPAGQAAG